MSETNQGEPADGQALSKRPLGISVVSGLVVLYALLWLLTGLYARDGSLAVFAMIVAAALVVLAWALYAGNAVAWGLTLAGVGASIVWRLSLVPRDPSNLVNAFVGVCLVGYLLVRAEFFLSR